jgi:homogentisate phytyltransferase/homogentisate geranylgeranyltransferase
MSSEFPNNKVSKSVTFPVLSSTNPIISIVQTIWDFTRPHTIVGSAISIICLYLYAIPANLWTTATFRHALISNIVPAFLMNLYITGLNQVTDVEIDKVNKPYLPIASGKLSKTQGIFIVISSLIGSILYTIPQQWPLKMVVYGSCILGTIYSLPPFRLKRFPFLAALCILVVRGTLVNLGFFLQAKIQVLNIPIINIFQGFQLHPDLVLLNIFFALFGVVIALLKDVPDIEGDLKFKIQSFSIRLGVKKMFKYVSI